MLLSLLAEQSHDEQSLLSKTIEIVGLPAGLIASPFVSHGHDIREAILMGISLVLFYAVVARIVLAVVAAVRHKRGGLPLSGRE